MADRSLVARVDAAIDALVRGTAVDRAADIDRLVDIAQELRQLPRAAFKARLRQDLERSTRMATGMDTVQAVRQTATPQLRVRNAAAALDFYRRAFDAREVMRFDVGGRIAHAEMEIGNTLIFVGEESPEHGYPGPEALGGSPVAIVLRVDNVDAVVERAVAAGARLVTPVQDQFYGDRTGAVADPFGHVWHIRTVLEEMTVEEMRRRFDAMMKEQPSPAPGRAGVRTVTPYLVATDAPALIEFVTAVFGGEETFRAIGSAGGVHAEVKVGDTKLMIGGGGPGLSWRGDSRPQALHVYVRDVDAAYHRALGQGASSITEPADHDYGERGASVKDRSGNFWYLATAKGANYQPEGLHTVNPYLHPRRAEPFIAFLKRAFDAEVVEKYVSPDGIVNHARLRIGETPFEMGEASGPYQPMPSMFYVYVSNADAAYEKALRAGAASVQPPANAPYGERVAAVKDVFGNDWYLGTPIEPGPQRGQ